MLKILLIAMWVGLSYTMHSRALKSMPLLKQRPVIALALPELGFFFFYFFNSPVGPWSSSQIFNASEQCNPHDRKGKEGEQGHLSQYNYLCPDIIFRKFDVV